MPKHKSHFGATLSLNWQANFFAGARIIVGKDAITKLPDLLAQMNAGSNVLVLKQPNLFDEQTDNLRNALHVKKSSVHLLEITGGEECKSIEWLIKIWEVLHEQQFTRKDTLIAIGGGAVTDVAGFAASTYLRGINLVTVPTTVLAQVDAAIGGKTAVNFHHGKNLLGSFYFAKGIVVDTNLLESLPIRQFNSGMAEVIKYALLEKTIAAETEYVPGPVSLLSVLEKSMDTLDWQNEILPGILIASIKMKLAVVGKDPYEQGLRRCLNLGHTLGHALESMSNFALSHGEAVSIGIAFAVHISFLREQLSASEAERSINILRAAKLPVCMPADLSIPVLLDCLFRDKKREGEAIKMILPKGELGIVHYNEMLTRSQLEDYLIKFKEIV